MQSDDLHPIPEGADKRAQLIAAGIQACLAGSLTSKPSTHTAAPPVAAPQPPEPVSGGHLAAAEVMRRVSAVVSSQVRLLQSALGT
jgi:hypothetical protein